MTINFNEAKRKKRKNKKPYDSISYTTGDVGLNIGRFNQAMGTNFGSATECTTEGGCFGESSDKPTKEDTETLAESWWKGIF
jgi:hypothetical protein